MAQCEKCMFFEPCKMYSQCRHIGVRNKDTYAQASCGNYEYDTKRGFSDELDEYLFVNHQARSGCCSSIENLKYDIAREVAEKMIEKFGINIQYVSQEERRKKMDEMYGVNLLKDV